MQQRGFFQLNKNHLEDAYQSRLDSIEKIKLNKIKYQIMIQTIILKQRPVRKTTLSISEFIKEDTDFKY